MTTIIEMIEKKQAAMENKIAFLDEARAAMAQAKEAFETADDNLEDAKNLCSDTMVAMAASLDKAQTTAILGEVFGFKLTSTGKESKTPKGAGEEIRKRIVRLQLARTWVSDCQEADDEGFNHPEAPAFIRGADVQVVEQMTESCESGSVSIWSFYNEVAKLKLKDGSASLITLKKVEDLANALATGEGFNTVQSDFDIAIALKALADMIETRLNENIETTE